MFGIVVCWKHCFTNYYFREADLHVPQFPMGHWERDESLCARAGFDLLKKYHLLQLRKSLIRVIRVDRINPVEIQSRRYTRFPDCFMPTGCLFGIHEVCDLLAESIVDSQYYFACKWQCILYCRGWIERIGIVLAQ